MSDKKKTADLDEAKNAMETGGVDETRFDTDVAEIIDIFGQVDELLTSLNLSSKPTTEDVRALTATVFIQRQDARNRIAPTPKESGFKTYATKANVAVECPKCKNTDINFTSKAGKSYQACKKCRVWIQKDGTTKPMD